MLKKRIAPILYGMTKDDLERDGGGRAILVDIHFRGLNEFGIYLQELHERVGRE